MIDCKGRDVRVGDRIVLLTGRERGAFGYVHLISTYPGRPRTPAIMAADCNAEIDIRDSEDWTWCSWLKSSEFALCPGGANAA